MVKVGMQKQAQFEQGVQKIQSQIDQVAGLDVLRDVDKNYLQTKLNELGGKLQYVAAGDFSNFQLVNSVSGMTKQISKDENVQNAVSSTAWYRKQAQEMESAIKQGKSSQANIWDFNEKANRYISSTDLKDKFTDRYTQYTDVDKKYMEVLKQLHPNLTEQDIPYERNADGSLNMEKTAAAMSRITKETVSSAQIENALRASLSPDDMNQLSINGRYEFRGLQTPEQLQQYSRTRFGSQIESVDTKINKLEGYKNLVVSDAGEYNKTASIIESLKAQKIQLQNNLNEELSMIAANPDQAKFQIYKNGSIAQFANAFSWETNKTQLLTNPILEAQHWEKDFAMKQSDFNLKVRAQDWTEYKGQFDMNMAEKTYNLAVKKQLADLYGVQSGMVFYGGKSTLVKPPDVAMQDDISSNNKMANDKFNEILKGVPNIDAGMLETALKNYANGDKSALKNIPVEWRDEADMILSSRAEAGRLESALRDIKNEVRGSNEFKSQEATLDKLIKNENLPSLTIVDNGVKYSFTPKEIIEYNAAKVTSNMAGAATPTTSFSKNLTDKEKVLSKLDVGTKGLYNIKPKDFLGQSENEKIVSATLNRYQNATSSYKKQVVNFNDAVNKKILERTGGYVPAMYNINVSNKDGAASRDTWEGIATSALMTYQNTLGGMKGGSAELSQGDIEKGRSWFTTKGGKEDIQYKKLVQGDKTFLVMTKGEDEVVVPLTDEIVNRLPVNENEPSAFNKKIKVAQQLGNGNTNPYHIPSRSIVQRWDFPNVNNLNVTADIKSNKTNPGKNYIVYNLRTPSGWKYLEIDNYPMSIDNIEKSIQTVTDADVKAYFLNDSTISASVKEEIRNL
jgi:hypothetical protein